VLTEPPATTNVPPSEWSIDRVINCSQPPRSGRTRRLASVYRSQATRDPTPLCTTQRQLVVSTSGHGRSKRGGSVHHRARRTVTNFPFGNWISRSSIRLPASSPRMARPKNVVRDGAAGFLAVRIDSGAMTTIRMNGGRITPHYVDKFTSSL